MEHDSLLKRFEDHIASNTRGYFETEEYEVLIDYFFSSNQLDKARIAVDHALEQYPYSVDFITRKAQLLAANKDTKAAFELLDKAEMLDPLDPEVFITRGSIYSQSGLIDLAIENYRKAIDRAAEEKDILEDASLYLAFEYENLNQYPDAEKYLKRVLELNPDNQPAIYELAYCFEIMQKDDEAITFYNEFIDKHPYNHSAWFNLGVSYNRQGQYEKAIDAYDYTIAIKENFAPAYFNKANSLANLKKYKEAIACYEETFNYEKAEAITYCYIGECYEKLKNYDKALVNYNKASVMDPQLGDAWLGMGIVMDRQEKLNQGIHYLKKAAALDPKNADYRYVLGDAYQKIGLISESLEEYKAVTELDPSIENIWLDYSNLLLDQGERTAAAEVIAQGIKHHPENAELFYRMTACLLLDGKKEEALTYLQSALQLDYKKHKEIFKFIPELKKDRGILELIRSYRKK